MERIAKIVASHYNLTVEEMKSKNNSRAIAMPRQVAMYLCKRLTKHSFPEIGREFGGTRPSVRPPRSLNLEITLDHGDRVAAEDHSIFF